VSRGGWKNLTTLTKEGEELFRLAAEGTLESFARFGGESARRRFVYFVRVLMHGLAEETNLLSITSAPTADEEMKSQPEPLRQ